MNNVSRRTLVYMHVSNYDVTDKTLSGMIRLLFCCFYTINIKFSNKHYSYYWKALGIVSRDLLGRRHVQPPSVGLKQVESYVIPVSSGPLAFG